MVKLNFLHKLRDLLSVSHWYNRLVMWWGAIIIGLIAAFFASAADYSQKIFTSIWTYSSIVPLTFSPLIFAFVAWLTGRFCPTAVGSGIPQAIAARTDVSLQRRWQLLGPRAILGKLLLTAIGLLGGASIGREGPTVQIGAAIMYLCGLAGGMSEEMLKGLIVAGAAAGIGAAFNTPLAGIVFAIEEMARAFEQRYSGVMLTSIVLAGAASLSILGNYSYFGSADGQFNLLRDLRPILVVGIFGGLAGALFARFFINGGAFLKAACGKIHIHNPVIFAGLCGFLIAILGLATHGNTYGSGYEQTKNLLLGKEGGTWSYMILKLVATAVSGFSGIPGGIFSPSLSVGAGLGGAMASWFPSTPVAGMVLLGMTAYFSGVTQAPMTAFIIILEVTGNQTMPVPLIAAALIGARVSRILCPVSLYHALAKNFLPVPDETDIPKESQDLFLITKK